MPIAAARRLGRRLLLLLDLERVVLALRRARRPELADGQDVDAAVVAGVVVGEELEHEPAARALALGVAAEVVDDLVVVDDEGAVLDGVADPLIVSSVRDVVAEVADGALEEPAVLRARREDGEVVGAVGEPAGDGAAVDVDVLLARVEVAVDAVAVAVEAAALLLVERRERSAGDDGADLAPHVIASGAIDAAASDRERACGGDKDGRTEMNRSHFPPPFAGCGVALREPCRPTLSDPHTTCDVSPEG